MKWTIVLNTVVGACLLLPTAFAQAAEEKGEPATIRLSHNILRYGQTTDEKKDGATEKEEATSLETFSGDVEIAAFASGYAFYLYPWNGGGSVLLGKAIGSDMEAGISAGLNFRNVKDGNEYSDNRIGAYYFYTRPITSKVTFEFDINPALIMGSSKEISGTGASAVETKKDANGYSLYLDLLGVIPIAKNFEYVFGIDYLMGKVDVKEKSGGTSKTVKYNTSDFGLILAKFRYFI